MLHNVHAKRAVNRWVFAPAVPVSVCMLVLVPIACTQNSGNSDSGGNPPQASGGAAPAAPENPDADTPEIAVVTPADLLEVIQKHQDKVVFVKFWATWCVPCVEEMPEVIEFYRKHAGSEDVALVSVSADLPESVDETVAPFLKEQGVPFPVWVIDAAGPDEIVEGLGLEESQWEGTLPAAFLLDKQGRLNKFWIGPIPEGAREEAINALLQ